MSTHDAPIDRDAISRTWEAIASHVRRTPLIEVDAADFGLSAAPLVLKLEHLQHSGSFKARGAFANLMQRNIPAAGVAAASGGNHGAAVAYAAARLGVRAHIFVPSISSPAKIERIRGYGADLVVGGATYADALAACEAYIAASGALSVHAYDQRETLLGQGTVGLELSFQDEAVDTVVVAVGGGGLIGGIAAWYACIGRVIGVEPEGAPTLSAALAAGAPVDVDVGGIAADSLGARRIGGLAYDIAKAHVDRVVLVDDGAIRRAQQALWDVTRLVVEPGGAAAFAAVLTGQIVPAYGERLCVLLCGANTTAVRWDAP
jgi:threonine dehydratase